MRILVRTIVFTIPVGLFLGCSSSPPPPVSKPNPDAKPVTPKEAREKVKSSTRTITD
ncbi:MAG: hypothetical protein U0746_15815 [Gemmataceae bacterium]